MVHNKTPDLFSLDVQVSFLIVCLVFIPIGLLIPQLFFLNFLGISFLIFFVFIKFVKKILELDR